MSLPSEFAHVAMTALFRYGAAVVLLVLSACGGDTLGPFDPITAPGALPGLLEVVSGDVQRGLTGRALADSIVVRARTPIGAPAAAVELSWTASAGTVGAIDPSWSYRGMIMV